VAGSPGFWQATLDSLSAHLAVLDEHGIILVTNASWDRFEVENGGRHAAGSDYLGVCEAAGDDRIAATVALALRAILSGERVRFELKYQWLAPGRLDQSLHRLSDMTQRVAKHFIDTVRGPDCAVALDDFGTGYASFRYLKQLPVSLLKIDQEFVRDLDSDSSQTNRHVIRAIVSLARGMGQKTVAEGVETEETLYILRELGVDYAQGYLFARPAPADEVFRDHVERQM